ncbi:hypothetical protein A5888_003768 [Enterococcus sp. 9E7_DIV0242]|uniref:Lipoprotein n=1 Tax=Candidatus Enterococcus clewellii TaxID=1834193 RepID=A0A242K5T3_9ENTE|nr:hypothetical protein A5888_001896 [Enterococcus sp. 9E7_DIV0242]
MLKKSWMLLSIFMITLILLGCQKSDTLNDQTVKSTIEPSTGKIMKSDQTSPSHSIGSEDFSDIPAGSLSEDDPVFDYVEDNVFIGEVLEAEKSETVLVKVKISDSFQECYIPIHDAVEVKKGQVIKIKTNGIVLETFPATFAEVYSVEVIR